MQISKGRRVLLDSQSVLLPYFRIKAELELIAYDSWQLQRSIFEPLSVPSDALDGQLIYLHGMFVQDNIHTRNRVQLCPGENRYR